jgi:hypothetical protein
MRIVITILLLIALTAACGRDEPVPERGTVTLDNKLYGSGPYYAIGFTFLTGKLTATNESPQPDITLLASSDAQGNLIGAYFSTSAFLPSFGKVGDYASAAEATTAFNALTEVPQALSWVELALPLSVNQIWIIKTRDGNYAKVKITGLRDEVTEGILYVECTFEWVFQADGSTTFPY